MGKLLAVTGGLIALYLVVSYATGAGTLLSSAATAYQGSVKALQGRG